MLVLTIHSVLLVLVRPFQTQRILSMLHQARSNLYPISREMIVYFQMALAKYLLVFCRKYGKNFGKAGGPMLQLSRFVIKVKIISYILQFQR